MANRTPCGNPQGIDATNLLNVSRRKSEGATNTEHEAGVLLACRINDAASIANRVQVEVGLAMFRPAPGNFVCVYIHRYGGGNGRIGRFIMNAMLAAGSYSISISIR